MSISNLLYFNSIFNERMVVKITSRQSHVVQNLLICCLLMTINGISMINIETIKFLACFHNLTTKFKNVLLVQI